MLKITNLERILFLDIETVPKFYKNDELDETIKALFIKKNYSLYQRLLTEFEDEQLAFEKLYIQTGGIQAEFGKIICISVGFLKDGSLGKQLRLKSFVHDDEETLLKQFSTLLSDHFNTREHLLCGHNIKEFDIPYICRRMLINGLQLPEIINIAGKKPWEVSHLDTLELWKFGDYKAYTSLALLCHVFEIPTPKDDISGADVARVYYENEKGDYSTGLARIAHYCEKDVLALVQLFLKFKGENLLTEAQIHYA